MANYIGYIAYIKRLASSQDRGSMADLKKGASAGTRQYAWAHMASFCDLSKETDERCFSLVGSAMALNKGRTSHGAGNIGASLKSLAYINGQKPGKSGSTDGRIKRLISCRTTVELCDQLAPVIRLLLSKGARIDFLKLLEDAHGWDEDVKRNWAKGYYT